MTYLHPDLGDLRLRALEAGYTELAASFTICFEKGKDAFVVDVPNKVYERVEVSFDFPVSTTELETLGFPL